MALDIMSTSVMIGTYIVMQTRLVPHDLSWKAFYSKLYYYCDAGGVSSAAPMQGSAMNNFAGRMGNILVGSMAGGFGATLGSDAANSLWHDFF